MGVVWPGSSGGAGWRQRQACGPAQHSTALVGASTGGAAGFLVGLCPCQPLQQVGEAFSIEWISLCSRLQLGLITQNPTPPHGAAAGAFPAELGLLQNQVSECEPGGERPGLGTECWAARVALARS